MFNLLAEMSAGTICDIVIAVLALIIVCVNIKKGFVKQIIGVVATIGAVLIAYLFCKDLLNLVNAQFGWQDKLADKLASTFSAKEVFNSALTEDNVRSAISSIGLPDFVSDAAVKLLSGTEGVAENVGAFLSTVLAKYLLLSLSFIVLFIVSRLLLGLLKMLIVKLFTLPILKGIDRLLAIILGLLKTVVLIYVVVYIIQLLPASVSFAEPVKEALDSSWIISVLNGPEVVSYVISKISGAMGSVSA